MLYIWPYFAFFSWPLLIVPIINIVVPTSFLPKYMNYGFTEKQKRLPRIVPFLFVLPVMLAVIHFNTVVHPFTLADNRHYVFYVFRLLLGVHPAIKYIASLVYFLCGWAVISAFGWTTLQTPPRLLQVPSTKPDSLGPKAPTKEKPKENRGSLRASRRAAAKKASPQQSNTEPISPEVYAKIQQHIIQRQSEQPQAPRVSLVLVWLIATTLSLVTAPLVEPRYFIIPWVMWRLHLPPLPTLAAVRQQRPQNENERARVDTATNLPRFMESLWFMVVNLVTGYVFLRKGFEWPQEPGTIQRFMW